LERFRESKKGDERGPVGIQSSLVASNGSEGGPEYNKTEEAKSSLHILDQCWAAM